MPVVALPIDQINVLSVTVLFPKYLLSFQVNFIMIIFFYFISNSLQFRVSELFGVHNSNFSLLEDSQWLL